MTVVCYEMSDSMSGSITHDFEQGETREVKRRYVIGQCVGFNDAVEQIAAYAPPYVAGDGAGIFWRRARLDVVGIGNKYFDCTATYSTMMFRQDENGGNNNNGGGGGGGGSFQPGSIAWDTTGNTEHITQGLVAEERMPANAADFKGAINVNGDGVDGLDVVRPAMRYSETWILPVSTAVGDTYVRAVFGLTGTVNLNAFRAFGPKNVLFLGARAQWQGDLPYVAVTYDFEARIERTQANNGQYTVPGIAGGVDKFGWEHVWIAYEPEANNQKLVRKPIAFYKNKVYEERDWSPLQIGGSIGTAPAVINAQLPGAPGQGFL
jgi:hypothetical protein